MSQDTAVEVVFYDVGQGDCSLLLDRQSATGLLVDCPASAVRRVMKDLQARGVRQLDVLVTHWDHDHYPGAVRIAKNYPARRFYYNFDTVREADEVKRDRRQSALQSVLDLMYIPTKLFTAREGVSGFVGYCNWTLLAPSEEELLEAHLRNDRNHGSAVVSARSGDSRVLIGGDADGRVWRRLLSSGEDLRSDILRCSHHGGSLGQSSDGVNDEELLDAIRPKSFVISVGAFNAYGHPFETVVHSARQVDARVLCTQATPRCALQNGNAPQCAGDVVIDFGSGAVSPDVAAHNDTMEALVPMCQMNPRQD